MRNITRETAHIFVILVIVRICGDQVSPHVLRSHVKKLACAGR